jgi:hypothetical protein
VWPPHLRRLAVDCAGPDNAGDRVDAPFAVLAHVPAELEALRVDVGDGARRGAVAAALARLSLLEALELPRTRLVLDELLAIVGAHPRLASLTLATVYDPDKPHPHPHPIGSSALTTLQTSVRSTETFAALLAALPALERALFCGSSIAPPDRGPPPAFGSGGSHARLRVLALASAHGLSTRALAWFCTHWEFPALEVLDLTAASASASPHDYRALENFPELRALSLSIYKPAEPPETPWARRSPLEPSPPLQLPALPELRYLSCFRAPPGDDPDGLHPYPCVAGDLATLSPLLAYLHAPAEPLEPLARLTSLTALHLGRVRTGVLGDLRLLVAALPRLRHLWLPPAALCVEPFRFGAHRAGTADSAHALAHEAHFCDAPQNAAAYGRRLPDRRLPDRRASHSDSHESFVVRPLEALEGGDRRALTVHRAERYGCAYPAATYADLPLALVLPLFAPFPAERDPWAVGAQPLAALEIAAARLA